MKLIILDRDGVINFDSDEYIKSPDEWKPIPGSMQAIARLNQRGYRVAVATNQAGISRGLFDMKTLGAMHHKLHQTAQMAGARIDAIFFCPHSPEDTVNAANHNLACCSQSANDLESVCVMYLWWVILCVICKPLNKSVHLPIWS